MRSELESAADIVEEAGQRSLEVEELLEGTVDSVLRLSEAKLLRLRPVHKVLRSSQLLHLEALRLSSSLTPANSPSTIRLNYLHLDSNVRIHSSSLSSESKVHPFLVVQEVSVELRH